MTLCDSQGEIVAQMSRLPLCAVRAGRIVQPLEPSLQIPKRFRILSLDGGGVRVLFHGWQVLAALEQDTGKSCVDHFDLIAGTSTGGIIAIGLGLGMTAADIVDFYRQYGPTIFPSTGLVTRLGWIRQLFRPKHSHLALRKCCFQIAFGDKKLGDSKCRLVIPTYDANRGHIFVLKTPHHPEHKHPIEGDRWRCRTCHLGCSDLFRGLTISHISRFKLC